MAPKDRLNYTADRLREGGADEQAVQATMQEETAIAIHRTADALEDIARILRERL